MFKNLFREYMEQDGNSIPEGGADLDQPVQTEPETPRTFTQEELNRIVGREKNKAQNSLLRDLGFENVEIAKESLEGLRGIANDNKSDIEKAVSAREEAEKKLLAANSKIEQFEQQISLLSAGVKQDKITQVSALLSVELSDDVTFEEALEQLKKDFPSLFVGSTKSKPQGHENPSNPPRNPRNQADNYSGIGKRLAEQKLKQSGVKVN